MSALLATIPGTSVVQDPVYPDRLTHVAELHRMGATITVSGYTQIIQGGALRSAPVKAADLRAGAALFIAGLTCEGTPSSTACSTSTAATNASPSASRASGRTSRSEAELVPAAD